jgi:DNA repair protein RadC
MVTINNNLLVISEVKLVYKTKIKASERPRIFNSQSAADIFNSIWDKDTIEHHEEMKLLLVNRSNKVLGFANLTMGGVSGTVCDITSILQYAIKGNASGIILCHNHPSGNINPSESDEKITKRVNNALQAIEVKLLDHLIITSGKEYYSFADNGLI